MDHRDCSTDVPLCRNRTSRSPLFGPTKVGSYVDGQNALFLALLFDSIARLSLLLAASVTLIQIVLIMSCFHVAFALPVNAPNASTKLSLQELWKGCDLLARNPQIFTDAISSCLIQSDSGARIVRKLSFNAGPLTEVDQEVILIENYKVYNIIAPSDRANQTVQFESTTMGTGNRVITTIFRGITDDPYDLYLSIEYSIPYGKVSSQGPDGDAFRASYTSRAKQNLVEGIAKMQELGKEGKLIAC